MDRVDLIGRFAAIARPLMLDYLPRNSCIASTRITIECLARFGIEAVPVPVLLVVKSRLAQFFLGLTRAQQAKAEREAAEKSLDLVRVYDPARRGWDGHLVAVAEAGDCRYLIDATFDQTSLPERGLTIPPFILAVPVPLTIPADSIAADLTFETDHGETLQVRYIPQPDPSFRETPAWETDHIQGIIDRICATLEPT